MSMVDVAWHKAVRGNAGGVLVTWKHEPRFYEQPERGPGLVWGECTTPDCGARIGPADSLGEAECDMAEHIATVHWPTDR